MQGSYPCLSLKELKGWSNVWLSVCRNQTQSHSTPVHVSGWMSIALCCADQEKWVTVSTHSLSDWNALQECLSCWERGCCYCSQPDSYRPTRGGRLFNSKQGLSQKRQKITIHQMWAVFRLWQPQAKLIMSIWTTQGIVIASVKTTSSYLQQTLRRLHGSRFQL